MKQLFKKCMMFQFFSSKYSTSSLGKATLQFSLELYFEYKHASFGNNMHSHRRPVFQLTTRINHILGPIQLEHGKTAKSPASWRVSRIDLPSVPRSATMGALSCLFGGLRRTRSGRFHLLQALNKGRMQLVRDFAD